MSTWPAPALTAEAGPRKFVTRHKGIFNGRKLAYRASVVETIVKNPAGIPAASMFTFAYTAEHVQDPQSRPVIFVFNGGPGGASNSLHFGAFGPKRMASFTGAAQADPKTPLIDNPYTVLDVADLVFIDPPDTGFSRMLAGVPPGLFHSVDGDSYVIAELIAAWLKDNDRLGSPKFLAGESYGTLRAVALARDLAAAKPGIALDGLVLISQAITYSGTYGNAWRRGANPVAAINRIPDMAALAWYYGKIDNKGQTLKEAVEKARVFARTEYAPALLAGNRLDPDGRQHIAQRLAELTSIPAPYYLSHNLRVDDYRKELLRDEGKVLTQFDGRETEPAASSVPDEQRDWNAAFLGLTENMNTYASKVLKVKGLGSYFTLVADPYAYDDHWKYIEPPAPLLNAVLAEQMHANPKLRLLVTQGIFDATSSMGSTELTLAQLDVPRERIVLAYYPGGHMLYSDLSGLMQFTADIRAFVTNQPVRSEQFPDVSPAL
jgi:carboxypeptidase C (cathepsin A)